MGSARKRIEYIGEFKSRFSEIVGLVSLFQRGTGCLGRRLIELAIRFLKSRRKILDGDGAFVDATTEDVKRRDRGAHSETDESDGTERQIETDTSGDGFCRGGLEFGTQARENGCEADREALERPERCDGKLGAL